MNEKKQIYQIKWTQPYSTYELVQEAIVEFKVANSELREARAILKQIMDAK